MQIFDHLEDFPQDKKTTILTLGTFDGMHRGHAFVLKQCLEATPADGQTVILTFKNHPSEILQPDQPTPLLCTIPHKLKLLESFGIDKVLLIPFTRSLAKQTAATFVEHVRQFIPFSHLLLGYNAVVGRDRQGDQALMSKLATQWGFKLEYLHEYRYEGKPISSSRIRELLKEGNLIEIENLLNRPYSIYSNVLKKPENTNIQLDVTNLCLPPPGKYFVTIKTNHEEVFGGIASIHPNSSLKIENDILQQNLEGKFVEVIFKPLGHEL